MDIAPKLLHILVMCGDAGVGRVTTSTSSVFTFGLQVLHEVSHRLSENSLFGALMASLFSIHITELKHIFQFHFLESQVAKFKSKIIIDGWEILSPDTLKKLREIFLIFASVEFH